MTTEQAFKRYRETGDADALGAVFDAVAQDLAIVAAHLAPSGVEAEDLVQETFLAAIEHRDRWRGDSRLVPWLNGILVNLSRRERQRERRAAPERPQPTMATPLDLIESREVAERIGAALRELPTHYRQVLTLRLVHGLQPSQIATALGRPVATCKTQLQRGIELLRRALPAAIASSLAGLLGTGEALAACRATVLAKASSPTPPLMTAGAAGATAGTLTGIVMNKVAVTLFAACVVATLVWYWSPGSMAVPTDAPDSGNTIASGAAMVRSARDRITDAASRSEAPSNDPQEQATSTRLHGRVVALDGRAIEGVWVLLVRRKPGSQFAGVVEFLRHRSLNPGSQPRVPAERRRRTDAEGRVSFARSLVETDSVLVAWSPTRGAKFAPLPAVEEPLADSEFVIELADHGQILGRVLGPDGQGVADAQLSVYPLKSGMPVASCRTDAAGNYRTVPLPPASYRIIARSPRHQQERADVDLGDDDARADIDMALLPVMAAQLADGGGRPWIGVRLQNVCGVDPSRFEALLTRTSCDVRADAARGGIEPVKLAYDPMTGRVQAAIDDPEVAFASFWWGEAKLGEVELRDLRQPRIQVTLRTPPTQVLRVRWTFEPQPDERPRTTVQLDRPAPGFAGHLIREASASSDGLEVTLTVPAGNQPVGWWLSVTADGYVPSDRPLDWPAGVGELVHDVTLRRAARAITGVVTDDEGAPVEACGVLLLGDDGQLVGRGRRVYGATDRDGAFRVDGLPDRALRVLVHAGERGMAAQDVPRDAAMPLRLELSKRRAFAVTGTDGLGLQLRALDADGKVLLDDRLSGTVRYGGSRLRMHVAGSPTRVEAYLPGQPRCIAAGGLTAERDAFALAPVGK